MPHLVIIISALHKSYTFIFHYFCENYIHLEMRIFKLSIMHHQTELVSLFLSLIENTLLYKIVRISYSVWMFKINTIALSLFLSNALNFSNTTYSESPGMSIYITILLLNSMVSYSPWILLSALLWPLCLVMTQWWVWVFTVLWT